MRRGTRRQLKLIESAPVGMSSSAPALYRELHKKFIHDLDRAKDSYEFVVTDQLRMSGELLIRHRLPVLPIPLNMLQVVIGACLQWKSWAVPRR